jgi:aminodeoxyfutalosine deaminase
MLLRSPIVFPVSDLPIFDGVVVVRHGRIQAVGPAHTFVTGGRDDVVELPGTALLPGMINAHTHLELSHLAGKIAKPDCFTDWLGAMIRSRVRTQLRPWRRWATRRSIRRGLKESVRAGVTLLGDVCATHLAPALFMTAPIRTVAFLEVLGLDPADADATGRELWALIEKGAHDHMRLGVSPHAPYSTSRELYEYCDLIARRLRCQLTTHLAETREEAEFCEKGTGPLRELIDSLGVLPRDWAPSGLTPTEQVESCGVFGRSILVAHANYVSDDDIGILRRSRSAVVYCPRSHAYFGHDEHPFRRLMEAGVTVALGTDSLASSPSLSILDEMRFLREQMPDLSNETILELGTLAGAAALRSERRLGSIEPGKRADLVALRLGADPDDDPHDALWHPATETVLSLCDGSIAYDPHRLIPHELRAEAAVRTD